MATVDPGRIQRFLNHSGCGVDRSMVSAAAPAPVITLGGRVCLPSAMFFSSLSVAFSQKCSLAPPSNGQFPERLRARDPRMCTTMSSLHQKNSPGRGKFRAPFLGKSNSLSCKEWLFISSRDISKRGRPGLVKTYTVAVTSTKFELQQTKFRKLLFKTLKISASLIHSWLRRKRRVLAVTPLSTGYLWRPAARRTFRFTSSSVRHKEFYQTLSESVHRVAIAGADLFNQTPKRRVGATCGGVNYPNSFSISTQADGNEPLENKTILFASGVREREQEQLRGFHPDGDTEDFLATGYGWRVRDLDMGEWRELIRVADIQTDAFHERTAIFDELFYKIFHAEVLSSLQYKARHSPPDRYSCLLAEKDPLFLGEIPSSEQAIVGAVDVTALANSDILCHLPGVDEYLYVSGMAVDSDYRRRCVATLLLEACLARARKWGFEHLILHAYEDDLTARNLYSKAGYQVIAADPAWLSTFFGRRQRVVMAKKIVSETY